MNNRIRAILEDYEGLLEMHEEYAELVDFDDIESREIWEQIEVDINLLARRMSNFDAGQRANEEELEAVETQIESLNDLYGDLAALFGGEEAATG